LVHLLRSQGYAVSGQGIAADAVASNDAHRTPFVDPPLICLSLLSTCSPARARYLIRRVRRQMPRAMVLVGLWGLRPAELTAAIGEIATSADVVVASLHDAVAKIDSALVSATAPAQLESTRIPTPLA